MLNYLLGCLKSTPIGMLPEIINHNNEAIESEFNWIYDASMNRLVKSVYAPTGSVKAHFGEFVNLSCEYITIKNVDSLKASIQSCVDEIISLDSSKHNILQSRFANLDLENKYKFIYTHDAESIVCSDEITVEEKLLQLDASIISLADSSIEFVYNDKVYTEEDIATIIDMKDKIEEI